MDTTTASWVGKALAGGRYQVIGHLGEGGMAFVYLARDGKLDCNVVIKVPRPAVLLDPEFAGRFAREVRSLVRLSHPHIVKITDAGEHLGLPFAVLQHLSGGSLRDRQPRADCSPPPTTGLSPWLANVAAALDFIHHNDYLHRDVKPDNILFDEHGHAYLSDFGIAKALTDNQPLSRRTVLTSMGMVLGTPEYMAPELVLGKPCDGRVDQYGLAVTVYEMLSGRVPFEGATPTAVYERQQRPPLPLDRLVLGVPKALAEAVHQALDKDPRRRFVDCSSFARAVLAGRGESPVEGRGAPAPPKGQAGALPLPTVPVIIDCPACKKPFKAFPPVSGKRLQCPSCQAMVRVTERRETSPARRPKGAADTIRGRQPQTDTRLLSKNSPQQTGTVQSRDRLSGQRKEVRSARRPAAKRWVVAGGIAGLAVVMVLGGWVLLRKKGVSAPAENKPPGAGEIVRSADSVPIIGPSLDRQPQPEATPTPPTQNSPEQEAKPLRPPLPSSKVEVMPTPAGDTKWGRGNVLAPDQFDASSMHVQVPSYDFSRDFKTMYFRLARGAGDKGPKADKTTTSMIQKRFGGKGAVASGQVKPQPGMRLPPGAGTVTLGMGTTDTSQEYDLVAYDLDHAGEATGEPAQVIIPYRMVVVSAAFPFRQQLEAFRMALRYQTLRDMLNDRDKDPVIEFAGINVKRRVLSPDGTVQSDWADLDISTHYKMMHRLAVEREPEDSNLVAYGVIENQVPSKLVQRLPHGFSDTPYPPKPNLPLLDAALEAQKRIVQDANPQAAPPKSRYSREDFDPDQPDESGTATPGMMSPGSSSPRGPTGMTPPGTSSTMVPGTANQAGLGQEPVLADQCLIRFLDLNVEPGHLYEYQIQIKMTNPAYKKPELAISEEVTKDQYILGEFKTVTTKVEDKEVPLQIQVPQETFYYAAPDEKAGPANADKAPVQVHRWLESVQFNDSDYPVGEWSILERDLIGRGENIGRMANVEVPWWDPKLGGFTLINSKKSPPRRTGQAGPSSPKVPADFNTGAILVDFEGGKRSYSLVPGTQSKTLSDESPVELLILPLDGKLIVHYSRSDADDPQRQSRVQAWTARLGGIKARGAK